MSKSSLGAGRAIVSGCVQLRKALPALALLFSSAAAATPGGLLGIDALGGGYFTVRDGYWDARTSGVPTGRWGSAKSTGELQSPTGYDGIYSGWNSDLDGDGVADSPWHFGTAAQYPALKAAGGGTWRSFGHQLRAGPRLTVTPEAGRTG